MADRRIDQLTEAEDIDDEDLFVIWKRNISQTRSIQMGTMNLALKEYVRNQNILSDWETITLSANSSSPTEMPYDGILNIMWGIVNVNNGYIRSVVVNSVKTTIFGVSPSSTGTNPTIQITVKKGDLVYLSDPSVTNNIRYYKLRDYTGR